MLELKKGNYSGNVVKSSEENGIICSHTSYYQSNFNGAKHYHENAHLSFVLEGYCMEKKRQSYDRKPGHFTFYHAGEPHQVLGVSNLSRHINIEIEPSFLQKFDIDECSLEFRSHDIPDIKFLMVKFYYEMTTHDEFTAISQQSILLNILQRKASIKETKNLPTWALLADQFLRQNRNDKVTLSEIATITGVHPITISKYFPLYFGCTLGDYMRKLKVEQSLFLMKSNSRTLTEVAYSCGFSDQSHFTRTFKNYLNILPSAFITL